MPPRLRRRVPLFCFAFCFYFSNCYPTDVLAVHRLAHFLEDTHLRHLPESDRSALFLPPPDVAAAAAAPAAASTTARPVSPDVATSLLSAYVTALAPTYAGAPAVGRFYSAPAVAAWLTRTALGVAVADAAAAAANEDDKDVDETAGRGGASAMDTATAGPTASAAAATAAALPAREAADTPGGGVMDTATGGGAGDTPPVPVVAGAAAHPAVRAAAAAVVAACGLAAPPGGSSAAAAASVAARHVLAWQAKVQAGAAADDAVERGDDAAASAAAPAGDGGAPLTLADFPSGIETGGTFVGSACDASVPWRLFSGVSSSSLRVCMVFCPSCAAISLTYGCCILLCFLCGARGRCVRVSVHACLGGFCHLPLGSGGGTADAAVDAVGGVLRLLHAARLAEVQRDINGALAAVQATTADARTDNRLWGRGH